MTIPTLLIWIGSIITLLGLAGLGYCIVRALAIRRESTPETAAAEQQKLVAVNVASVGIATLGLCCVIVGVIL